MKRLTDLHIKILVLAAIALFVLLVLFPKPKTNQESSNQISGLVPQALEVFGYCLDAAVSGEPLTAEALEAALNSNTEGRSSLIEYLKTDLEDNFECIVEIPRQYYDRKALGEHLEILRSTRSDDRLRRCQWRISSQQTSASVLDCSLKSDTESKTSFRVSFISIASDSAYFWIRPTLTFDSDGRIISIND